MLVAAEVGEGPETVRTLVLSGADDRHVERFSPWAFSSGPVGIGSGGPNDLFVWTQPVRYSRHPDRMKPGDYALSVDVEDALCERLLSADACSGV